MATHSSILAWKIPWTEEPGRLQSMRSQRADTTEGLILLSLVDFPVAFFLKCKKLQGVVCKGRAQER